jgi:hypothetical protein
LHKAMIWALTMALLLSGSGVEGYRLCPMGYKTFKFVYADYDPKAGNETGFPYAQLTAACRAVGLEPAIVSPGDLDALDDVLNRCSRATESSGYAQAWLGSFANLPPTFGCHYLSYQGGIFSDAMACSTLQLPGVCQPRLQHLQVSFQTQRVWHSQEGALRTVTVTAGDAVLVTETVHHVTHVTSTLVGDLVTTLTRAVIKTRPLK